MLGAACGDEGTGLGQGSMGCCGGGASSVAAEMLPSSLERGVLAVPGPMQGTTVGRCAASPSTSRPRSSLSVELKPSSDDNN